MLAQFSMVGCTHSLAALKGAGWGILCPGWFGTRIGGSILDLSTSCLVVQGVGPDSLVYAL